MLTTEPIQIKMSADWTFQPILFEKALQLAVVYVCIIDAMLKVGESAMLWSGPGPLQGGWHSWPLRLPLGVLVT